MGTLPGFLWKDPWALPEQGLGGLPPLLCGTYTADQWQPGYRPLLSRRNGGRDMERSQQGPAELLGVRLRSSFLLLHPEGA